MNRDTNSDWFSSKFHKDEHGRLYMRESGWRIEPEGGYAGAQPGCQWVAERDGARLGPSGLWSLLYQIWDTEDVECVVETTRTTPVGAVITGTDPDWIKTMNTDMEELRKVSFANPPQWPTSAKRPEMRQVPVMEQTREWTTDIPDETGMYYIKVRTNPSQWTDSYREWLKVGVVCVHHGVADACDWEAHQTVLTAFCPDTLWCRIPEPPPLPEGE